MSFIRSQAEGNFPVAKSSITNFGMLFMSDQINLLSAAMRPTYQQPQVKYTDVNKE